MKKREELCNKKQLGNSGLFMLVSAEPINADRQQALNLETLNELAWLMIALEMRLERTENMTAKPTTEPHSPITYLVAGVFPIYFF